MQASVPFKEQLSGRELPDGWVVQSILPRSENQTGGTFSCGYLVENKDGRLGFLKAQDLTHALNAPEGNIALAVSALTDAFKFESDLCFKCKDRKLDRVVHPLASGEIRIDPKLGVSVVLYLVFERAQGDVRTQLAKLDNLDYAWVMRSLHNVANGLRQLHSANIAHQDLKPSNVLTFQDRSLKIADLGRASLKDTESPYDDLNVAGDMQYAPPELLYGFDCRTWQRRRLGCDIYLLGSMATFFFSQCTMNGLLFSNLDKSFLPKTLGGECDEAFEKVLPYLLDAFEKSLGTFASAIPPRIDKDIKIELVQIIKDLCFPDPLKRGDQKAIKYNQSAYDLQRFVSRFDTLARKLEVELRSGN